MHACMGHRAAARSLLAIAAKLPSLSAGEHTQKARCSVIGWGNPTEKCSGKSALAWPEDYKTAQAKLSSQKKNPTYGPRKFKVKKSNKDRQNRLQEVQEVFKTCSGVGFGQPECEHRGSKSGQWLGEISPY